MSRPVMKKQKKGEPVMATFERFHKWAADVNTIIRDKYYKKPRLGTGCQKNPYPPKDPQFHLKAVKGKRRRILMQDDTTIAENRGASDTKDTTDGQIPTLSKNTNSSSTQNEKEEKKNTSTFVSPSRKGLITDILSSRSWRYIKEGYIRRNRPTHWKWAMDHKLMIYAHILWFGLYVTPLIWYFLFYPPENMVETKHGFVWPAVPIAAPPDNGTNLPFHFRPPYEKQKVGWDERAILGYAGFFVFNIFLLVMKWQYEPPKSDD
ncbi:uncharacterized protein DFL_003803 [Arthrobotrys flagrans]|uniref:Uncharacterized protein n=1 Tax=Arthrobotrys flagrans TaxID=97331 RepID=A0A437A2W4_ARTFL|nr:hypothetical protein DFL_003803 [Arthrobotrys flagrans]